MYWNSTEGTSSYIRGACRTLTWDVLKSDRQLWKRRGILLSNLNMRCIEIHKPTWPLQGRKSSNLNMRCIEISLPRWRVSLLLHSRTLTWDVLKYFGIELKRKFGKMSNLNMRCIEMRLYWAINSLSLLSNLNMRCIEIDACGMGGHCSVGRTLTWDVLK